VENQDLEGPAEAINNDHVEQNHQPSGNTEFVQMVDSAESEDETTIDRPMRDLPTVIRKESAPAGAGSESGVEHAMDSAPPTFRVGHLNDTLGIYFTDCIL
jgi:hypothetical protein